MKFPNPLKPGDRVRILSPSGPVNQERLIFGISVLEKWGLEVDVDPQCYLKTRYLAGSDQARLKALQNAINDTSVKAVFFSRGGYGLSRIVSDLNLDKLLQSPKWFVGFSDITAFLLKLSEHSIGGGIHGPVVASFLLQKESLPELKDSLFDRFATQEMEGKLVTIGSDASGPIWGGNLSIVVAELAAGDIKIPKNAVVFLEDVGEADYRLDRLLTVFARAAIDANVQGVLLGTFNDCAGVYVTESDMSTYVKELAKELAGRLNCTVITDLPIGHTARNSSLLLGTTARIHGNKVQILAPHEL